MLPPVLDRFCCTFKDNADSFIKGSNRNFKQIHQMRVISANFCFISEIKITSDQDHLWSTSDSAGLRDTSSSISVTATLENAQRIVSKIPETAANEEDIAPLLQEFEDLTSQLQAELDKLSAVTNNLGPSSL